jgi:O-antigen/teichoic acid export membrane protein
MFGIWQNIGDWLGYFAIMATVIPTWSLRYIARGDKNAAKTGIVLNSLIGTPLMLAYLMFSGHMAGFVGASPLIYAVASIQVLGLYLIPAFESIANALKPEVIAYGQILRETVKVGSAYLLIMGLRLGIMGAIMTVTIVYSVDIIYLAARFPWVLKRKLDLSLLRDWFKGSILTLYNIGVYQLWTFDMLMLALIASVNARAYYGAAFTIGSMISYSIALSVALYPKLLAGGGVKEIETAFRLTLMFAVPMTVGVIVYAQPYLTILNPIYTPAKPILILLACSFFLGCFTRIYRTIVYGLEKVDARGRLTLKQLMKSSFFLLPTIGLILAAIYLPMLYFILSRMIKEPIEAGIAVALLTLVFHILRVIVFSRISKRTIEFSLPMKALGRYFVASAVMAFILLVLPTPTRILYVFAGTLVGVTTYFLVLTLIDQETRGIISILLKTFKNRMNFKDTRAK